MSSGGTPRISSKSGKKGQMPQWRGYPDAREATHNIRVQRCGFDLATISRENAKSGARSINRGTDCASLWALLLVVLVRAVSDVHRFAFPSPRTRMRRFC